MGRMCKTLLRLVTVSTITILGGQAVRAPTTETATSSSSSSQQCVGTFVDPTRRQSLEDTESVATLMEQTMSSMSSQQGFEFGPQKTTGLVHVNFATRDVRQVFAKDDASKSTCLAEKHRMRELVDGIPIFGADFVVTTSSCNDLSIIDKQSLLNTNTLTTMDQSSVRAIEGYTMTYVNVPSGYTAKHTEEEATTMLSDYYGVPADKITGIKLEIYPTETRDYLAWIATVLVETAQGGPFLYFVAMDDDGGEIILQCDIAGFRSTEKQEKLQQRRRLLSSRRAQENNTTEKEQMCVSCAENGWDITWNANQTVECDVQTLYLNNDGRKTICISGVDGQGNARVGPGPVPQYFWSGTYNCNSQANCAFSPLPNCTDAISDVQYGALNFFRYLQENLGVMGGISKDANDPVPVVANVHYEYRYCNAFYVPGANSLHFGDCDCEMFTPLVSTDVVVHEITHGLTRLSSNLFYFDQSGGLNEAYSDIMACALEFTINDSKDVPDFHVGEALGDVALRNMEFPAEDGKSIDSYCTFVGVMNVHHSSGFLNKAYVNAVRSCEATCAGSTTSDCANLLAQMFLYTNMESLSMFSNFRDAARNTCRDVEEFFVARSPTVTTCSTGDVRAAIVAGFAAVGLELNAGNCGVDKVTCDQKCLYTRVAESCANLVDLIGQMTGWWWGST